MKANELRIGNWCNIVDSPFKNETGEHQIEAITIRYFECKDGLLVLEPIPLTEEWLIKFKFHRHLGNNNHLLYSLPDLTLVRYEKEDDFNGYWLKYYQGKFPNKLKYVHQLQNLYFALTEEELII